MLNNNAIEYDQMDRDELKVQSRSKYDITAPLRPINCIDQNGCNTGRCTLAHHTETRLKEITHPGSDPRSRTSEGKTESDKDTRNGAFPYQHPFNNGYRVDPSMFPHPHDSNLGNTEFEQGALDRIAGAEVRAQREHKRMSTTSNLRAPSSALNPKASVFTPSGSGNVSLYRGTHFF